MRKAMSAIGILAILFSLMTGLTVTAGAAWDGETATAVTETAKDGSPGSGYYLVSTAAELKWVAEEANTFEGKTVILTTDIDLNGENTGVSWTGIGSTRYFKGTFDGKGHTVKGLYISGVSSSRIGFFSRCEGATIENLAVNGTIHATQKENNRIGGICGYAGGGTTFRNCISNVDITVDDGSGGARAASGSCFAGGVLGMCEGFTSEADADTQTHLIYVDTVTVSGCVNTGAVSVNIINGTLDAHTETLSGSLVSGGKSYNGGLIGQGESVEVSGCTNTGQVSCNASDDAYVGGVAGSLISSSARYCVSSGAVSSYSGVRSHAGGVFGAASGKGEMANCLNTGSVDGASRLSTNHVGGVTGLLEGAYTVTNCVNTGAVTNSWEKHRGGITGVCANNKSSIMNCYWGGSCMLDAAVGLLGDSKTADCYRFDDSLAFSGGASVTVGGTAYTDAVEALRARAEADDAENPTGLSWYAADGGVRLGDASDESEAEPPVPSVRQGYSDLDEWGWASESIGFVIENGIMGSTEPDTLRFDAGSGVTRGMTVTILYRLAGSPTPTEADIAAYNGRFADVASDAWYYDAVVWAVVHGVTDGAAATAFGPDADVTREQLVTLFYRFAAAMNYDLGDAAGLSGYTDTGEVSPWALDAFGWSVDAGIVNGTTETTLSPLGGATRAQLAAIIRGFADAYVTDGDWVNI